ncbi:unnamed protein product [Amoebophrya sp. A120]|nr:unnamed protein product [Amoebophrya sp. A120]|eukprot:GSA120T00002700001.1
MSAGAARKQEQPDEKETLLPRDDEDARNASFSGGKDEKSKCSSMGILEGSTILEDDSEKGSANSSGLGNSFVLSAGADADTGSNKRRKSSKKTGKTTTSSHRNGTATVAASDGRKLKRARTSVADRPPFDVLLASLAAEGCTPVVPIQKQPPEGRWEYRGKRSEQVDKCNWPYEYCSCASKLWFVKSAAPERERRSKGVFDGTKWR